MLEKTNRVNMLFDFYAPLLKDRQKQFLEMYYREDYSLGEIAELTDVSRQAVYEQLRRAEQVLEQFEQSLQLHARYIHREQLLLELQLAISSPSEERERIKAIVQQLVQFELEPDEEA